MFEDGNNTAERYISILNNYKKKYKTNKITIFYQIGDFYEIYGLEYPDGSIVGNIYEISNDLSIQMACKSTTVYGDSSIKVLMSGVQINSLDKYVSIAVNDFSWTVVIYEQVKEANKITRQLKNIVTPGLNLNTNNSTNILLVIYLDKVNSLVNKNQHTLYCGISYIDSLTGESGVLQYPQREQMNDAIIYDEIIKFITIKNPQEIKVYTKNLGFTESKIADILHLQNYNYSLEIDNLNKDYIKKDFQENIFNKIYTNTTKQHIFNYLEIYNDHHIKVVLTIILEYIIKVNLNLLHRIKKPIKVYNNSNNLILGNNSLEQLNIVSNIKKTNFFSKTNKSLLEILDKTYSILGKRLFRNRLMNPITDIEILNNRYNITETFIGFNIEFKKELKSKLKNIIDLKKYNQNIARNNTKYIDIYHLYESIILSIELNTISKDKGIESLLVDKTNIDKLNKMIEYIESEFNIFRLKEIKNNDVNINIFNKGINKELDSINETINKNKNIMDILIHELSILIDKNYKNKKTNIINKGKNSNYDHYIYTTTTRSEILKEKLSRKNIRIYDKEFTKTDFEFKSIGKNKIMIIVECIDNSSNILIENIELLKNKTRDYFEKILLNIYKLYFDSIDNISDFVAEIDLYLNNSNIAIEYNYSKPTIKYNEESYIKIKEIRHPIIERLHLDTEYIPNDLNMGLDSNNGILLFGVNAVGKSSLMKSIGCNVLMAQSGLFVSSSDFIYSPFKYLFTRICSNDNLYAGLSTFEVEMQEFKIIMKYADKNSIILGDEICSGTETMDATSIVAAGIQHLSKRKANFLFATHLHYLAKSKYINELTNIKCLHMNVIFDKVNNKLIYNRKLLEGSGPSSYGIEVCKGMGMDSDFMELAQSIRNELSNETDIILGKKSKYNNNKRISSCEICGELAVDTHHIKFQCTANETGHIEHFHKDSKFNLVGLCKECHNNVHSVPPKLRIDGYQMSSNGIELKYEKLKKKEDILIEELFNENMTIKQIQNNMKKKGYTIKQNYIKEVLGL